MYAFGVACLIFVGACQDQRGLPKKALDWSSSRPVSDPFEARDADIIGDSIFVQVSYSGGCAEHEFELQTLGPQVRSLPPKQQIILFHQANGDACRAHIEQTLSFSLHPFRMSPHGITVLLFNDTTLIYRYE
ncbi:MAG TPA: hypothetical protein DD635_04085 [Flavobacteriales bacterium]|nr:hypothetical protein [Flavobacteriales bacterium]